jgi:hypothetical protein
MSKSRDTAERIADIIKNDEEAREQLAEAVVERMQVDEETAEGERAQAYRRDVLKSLGLLGAGAAVGGGAGMAAVDRASAGTQQAGTIGTSSNPVDIEAEDIVSSTVQTATIVDTDDGTTYDVGTDLAAGGNGDISGTTGFHYIGSSDDLQPAIDTKTNRSATIVFVTPNDTYNFPQASTVTVGQNTVLEGINGDLIDQPESDTWDFLPRPVLDFSSSAQRGFQSDPNATYRVHHPVWKDLTIVGSGYDNGVDGVSLQPNGNGTKVGFAEFENVFVEDFETCIDGEGSSDGTRVEKCHFRNCTNGITGVSTETWVRGSTFWHFEGNGRAIEVAGPRSIISECEFEMGGGSGAETDVDGVVVNAEKVNITDSHFKTNHARSVYFNSAGIGRAADCTFEGSVDYGVFIDASGSSVMVTGSTFDMSSFTNNVIRSLAPSTQIVGNDFQHLRFSGAADSSKDLIVLEDDYAVVANNAMPATSDGGTFNSNVKVTSSASDCRLWGRFPDGVIDNGNRTVINGASTNAGSPNTGGQWNGFSDRGRRLNVTLYDTTNGRIYKPAPGAASNDWLAIDN